MEMSFLKTAAASVILEAPMRKMIGEVLTWYAWWPGRGWPEASSPAPPGSGCCR